MRQAFIFQNPIKIVFMISKQRIKSVVITKQPLTPKNTNKLVHPYSKQIQSQKKEKKQPMFADQNMKEDDDVSIKKKRFSLHPALINNKKTQENTGTSKQSKSGYLPSSNRNIVVDGYIKSSKENIPKIDKFIGSIKKDHQFQMSENMFFSPGSKKSSNLISSIDSNQKVQYLTPRCDKKCNTSYGKWRNNATNRLFAFNESQSPKLNTFETSFQNLHEQIARNAHHLQRKKMKYLQETTSNLSTMKECSDFAFESVSAKSANKQKSHTLYSYRLTKEAKTPTFLRKKVYKQLCIQDFLKLKTFNYSKYGEVSLQIHHSTGFLCIIKSINKKVMQEEDRIKSIISQIKIQSYLEHPNIVKLLGFFDDKTNFYLIIEYCPHGSLHQFIQKKHPLKNTKQSGQKICKDLSEEQNIFEILVDIFQAIQYMHGEGILHRDLKPENIVLSYGVHKICDFGWSVYAPGETRTTFCGTPLYISPQLVSGKEYDEKIDIWGLGIICYELVYGRVPFKMFQATDMMKIIDEDIKYERSEQVSQKIIELMKKMLVKDSEKRLGIEEVLEQSVIREKVLIRRNQYQI